MLEFFHEQDRDTRRTAKAHNRGTKRNSTEARRARRDSWLDTDEPLTDAEKAVLDARLAAYENDPDAGSSWAEVEARIRARF